MNHSNENDNFFDEADEEQFDPQDLTSGGSQQESQGASQGGMGSQKTQSSRTGIKPADKKEGDDMTAGKYSFTHDDLVDPDE